MYKMSSVPGFSCDTYVHNKSVRINWVNICTGNLDPVGEYLPGKYEEQE